jgi:hypothetical protein
MKYKVIFKSKKIRRCWDCPMCRAWDYDGIDYCKALGLWVKGDENIPDICPLEVVE